MFAVDVQEEIECLYEFVPEVEEHFAVVDKIGEGKKLTEKKLFTLKSFENSSIDMVLIWLNMIIGPFCSFSNLLLSFASDSEKDRIKINPGNSFFSQNLQYTVYFGQIGPSS